LDYWVYLPVIARDQLKLSLSRATEGIMSFCGFFFTAPDNSFLFLLQLIEIEAGCLSSQI
jgi:hypothetical protein